VTSLWLTVKEDLGSVPSIIVNSAGITRDNLFISMQDTQFDEVMDVNLKGTFLVTQIGCQQMIQHGVTPGAVINISSVSAKFGNVGQANYCASKAAVIGFTRNVAREMARFNIRANTILPGFISTPMTDAVPAKVSSIIKAQIPLARFGHPEEVASVATFLAGSEAGYITGASIDVNGGLAM